MSDKVLKECCVEMSHGRLAEVSGSYAQYPSKKQHRIKDKRSQQYYAGGGKKYAGGNTSSPFYQSPSKRRSYSGGGGGGGSGQRWSEQRSPREEKPLHRDGVREEKALSPGQPSARPGGGDVKRKSTPVSLNHLLNFTVAPREHRVGGGAPPASRRRRSKLPSYNKEQFLQANCQFVVSVSGDYDVHTGDPDLLVEWEKIQQVRLLCHQIPSCPICLYPPRAAKISRCGHVYCWSCVLHYLSLGEKKWRKCPICYESIYNKDLKSVMALSNPQYKVGNTITMKLMMREKGATQIVPKCDWAERKMGLPSLEDSSHNKLLTATPAQVLKNIIKPERAELTAQLENLDKDEISEQCFIESALEELKAREAILVREDRVDRKITGIVQGVDASATKHSTSNLHVSEDGSVWRNPPQWLSHASDYFESEFDAPFSDSEDGEKQESLSTGSRGSTEPEGIEIPTDENPPESESSVHLSPVTATSKGTQSEGAVTYKLESSPETPCLRLRGHSSPIEPRRLSMPTEDQGLSQSPPSDSGKLGDHVSPSSTDSSPRSIGSDFVYFYQASDGQHLYLHPISAKCLVKEHGSLEYCPDEIKASIVEMEQLSMTEEVRSRYRYLSHLPLTCEFVLCELDLKPPTVSRETLRTFSDELQRRRQKRMKKKREEKRRERKTEVQLPQASMFPVASSLTPERFHDLLSLTSASPGSHSRQRLSQPSPRGEVAVTVPRDNLQSTPETSTKANGVPPVPQSPRNDTPSAPSFAQALQGKPPPTWPINTSPKSHTGTEPKPSYQKAVASVNSDEDECIPSFQEAFNEAVLSASMAAQTDSGGKPGSKTAKKGRKKMVLFSTGGARGTS